jgi:hypothetical protein
LEQLNSGGTCFPCHLEWVIIFLCQPAFSYVISCSGNFQPRPVRNYSHKLCFIFMYVFVFLNPHVVSCFSLYHLLSELCNLVAGGSICGTCHLPGVPWLFSCLGFRVPKWLPLRKAIANGGSGMCSLLGLVPYPKHAHSTSRMLSAKYWGPRWCTP